MSKTRIGPYRVQPGGLKSTKGNTLTFDIYLDSRKTGAVCTFWNVPGDEGRTARDNAQRVCDMLNASTKKS
jgi:hypothetical protein